MTPRTIHRTLATTTAVTARVVLSVLSRPRPDAGGAFGVADDDESWDPG
ncbi:hypothetical protein [Streptomyces katsurahamanus]|nr:hypothetical protein [Streptomyces katsurahamanus]